ncbi:hypothetical protein LZ30DRAFT_147188 [Colletotrichum cereale]|nr:hypothetical protein LZ30DRAFT_147188 [Colletotrichum cereale]
MTHYHACAMLQTTTWADQTSAFVWDRPAAPENWENKPFIVGETKGNITGRRLLEAFLDIPDHSSRSNYELSVFNQIFDSDKLEQIRDGNYEDTTGLTVWIHDRNSTTGESRPYNGPVLTKKFDEVLKRKRLSDPEWADVHIRRMYLPNPYPSTLGVLALSSSQQHSVMIREMIYKHLKGDTSLSVEFGLAGRNFTFESHIPFFVLKRSTSPKKDNRMTSKSKPIRKTHDLSFLSRSHTRLEMDTASDVLHECHTSMVMTGWNLNFWTAWCLNDTYYYDDDGNDCNNEDMLLHYVKGDQDDEFSHDLDPLSIGKLSADHTSPKDPREYFLLVLRFRIQKYKEEWANILHYMNESVCQYLLDTHIPLLRGTTTLGNIDDHSEAVQNDEAWVRQTSNLLTKLIAALSKIIRCCRRFHSRDARLITMETDAKVPSRTGNSLHLISRIIDDFEGFLDDLNDLRTEVENFKSQISLHVAVDGGRAIGLQYWNVTIVYETSFFVHHAPSPGVHMSRYYTQTMQMSLP